jgi:hypothetical protein
MFIKGAAMISHNPHVMATHSYRIVDDLAQSHIVTHDFGHHDDVLMMVYLGSS